MNTPTIDATGLDPLRTAEVLENMIERLKASAAWGDQAQTGSSKLLGQLLAIPAEEIGLCYEALQQLYDMMSPTGAEGVHLDNQVQLMGLTRDGLTYSNVTCTLTGTIAATLTAGHRARVPDGPIWTLLADATYDGGGTVDATFQAVTAGEITADAATITEIVDADPDWTGVTNAGAATPGEDIETDAALQVRRFNDITRAGRCTDRATRAGLQDLSIVVAAIVISNRTMATVDGVPAKSFEAVVWPSTVVASELEEIAEALWTHLPTAGYSHGNDETATITDYFGKTQTVRWSWASEIVIHWDITVTLDTEADTPYPADGDQMVEDAILAYGATLSVGRDVLPATATGWITSPQSTCYVPGVKSMVMLLKAGGAPGPGDTVPISISDREASTHAAGNIAVTS